MLNENKKNNTVILKWNPAFSSASMLYLLHNIYITNCGEDANFNWSVNDYEHIALGDRFFMVKVGQFGQNGILMSGIITSDPMRGEDWSGRGRVTYYVNFRPDVIIDPDAFPILSSNELQSVIPDFDWFKGHSGVILNNSQADKLAQLWHSFLQTNYQLFSNTVNKSNGREKLYWRILHSAKNGNTI